MDVSEAEIVPANQPGPRRGAARLTRRLRLAIGAVALTIGAAAVVVSAHTDPATVSGAAKEAVDVKTRSLAAPLKLLGKAPALDTSSGWLNDKPGAVDGKVVLYELWTFGCYNCKNTLPYVRALWDRYQPDGLQIVGIHTPEFDYEADPANVSAAAAKLGVTWPVLLDPKRTNWQAFDNRYWPRVFITDASGQIRFDHVGEGAYASIEDAVRTLLGVDPSSPRAEFPPT